ncbi:MAG: 30S ribosomal protein S2 [Candidatus Kapaibacteriota bacterium]
MKHYADLEALLKSGAHFGHLTRRWNPAMEKFIFMERNGIHIIDLRKTQILIDYAREAAYNIASKGKIILFIGTKLQAKNAIKTQATKARMNYVSERWLGGMLTNFTTIRKSIKRLNTIDKMAVDGTYENLTKKERLMLDREKERLRKVFGGIEMMTRLPGALFIVDIKKEHLAIKEAKILGIPIIGIVDTNSDPSLVDFPIPANDDSANAVEYITSIIADAILEGNDLARSKSAELNSDSDRIAKEQEMNPDEAGKMNRKMRTRRNNDGDNQDSNQSNNEVTQA